MRQYRGDGKLDALTLEVILNNSYTFHAPTSEGDALCGRASGVKRRRRVDSVGASASPCGHCFSPEIVEQYEGRDGDVVAAVRGE